MFQTFNLILLHILLHALLKKMVHLRLVHLDDHYSLSLMNFTNVMNVQYLWIPSSLYLLMIKIFMSIYRFLMVIINYFALYSYPFENLCYQNHYIRLLRPSLYLYLILHRMVPFKVHPLHLSHQYIKLA